MLKFINGVKLVQVFGNVGNNYMPHNFNKIHVKELGLQYDGSVLSHFLNKGQTYAFFHSEGRCPVWRDFSNKRQITGAVSIFNCFKTTGLIESGPAALSDFKLDKSLMTPLRYILIYGIVGHLGFMLSETFSWNISYILGCLKGDKHEQTYWKCAFNSAFLTLSQSKISSESFNIEVPWLSCLN